MALQRQLDQSQSSSRPSFALKLVRDHGDDRLIVYELLSAEQAEARRQRFERVGTDVHIKPIDDALTQDVLATQTQSWNGWQAIRVASVNGQRYTALRNRLVSGVIDIEQLEQERAMFVSEPVGVQVALGTLAVLPLSKLETMQRLLEGVASMADDECYYWHTLCRSPNDLDGAKALRTLYS
ncbi:DUF7680 family protein [Halobacterium salinarum]|uniref:DUF7680 family protein n=1 Tax=Halobacterium salinarum TaxID=2242 RepID=UPI0025524A92|nr:hypothetical protein [Halobacterium salinarum]MDL0145563.1 hypothetical protein [Halobacterium salinarum]